MNGSIQIKKSWLIFLAVAAAAMAIAWYFYGKLLTEKVIIPTRFLEARASGAILAGDIVDLASRSMDNLVNIGADNVNGNYGNGLDLVLKEISRNAEARAKAIALSSELEIMAKEIANIKPPQASDIALSAVVSESQIVQRLINYNGYIYELLNGFESRFSKKNGVAQESIKAVIDRMNIEIGQINILNDQYKDLMNQFDALVLRES